MRFNTRIRYGMRTMIEIARANQKEGVLQKEIAQKQLISVKYLDVIIHSLKKAGLICNVKGKKSGYILARPPQKITMLDVYNAFEKEGICVNECCEKDFLCKFDSTCEVKSFWGSLNDMMIDYFRSFTLYSFIGMEFSDAEKNSDL